MENGKYVKYKIHEQGKIETAETTSTSNPSSRAFIRYIDRDYLGF